MYHQFGDPSHTVISYSDLSLLGTNSSSNSFHDQELELLHRQFGGSVPMQSSNYHLLQMLNPGNFHGDQFVGEIPNSAGSVASAEASTIFYDPLAVGLDLQGNYNKGSIERDMYCLMPQSLEEGYGRLQANVEMVSSQRGTHGRSAANELMEVEEGAGSHKNEKKRRERLFKKFEVLKSLIPNPTKNDRATIVADAIDYINELLRTMDELKLLLEKKRRRRAGSTTTKVEMVDEVSGDMESSCMKPLSDFKGSLRSSWLRRKSKETLVDVRIVEDEVFIKLTQHKKSDCLLVLSQVFEELELELLHLSGANIGDLHIFMINAKIHEGSSVYASAIAKKILEVMAVNFPQLAADF